MVTEPDWHEAYEHDMLGVFHTPERLLVRGQGCVVWDDQDRRYLDFLGGIAVNALGHNHPALVAAIAEQAALAIHVSNVFASHPQLALASKLKQIARTGDDGKVFFCNSGTEANEAAFKLARRNNESGVRTRIIAFEHAFHGRTMGSLSLTPKSYMQDPFKPLVPGVEILPVDEQAVRTAVDDTVAAVIVETIQGEAGVLPLPEGFLRTLREVTAAHGALLIVDEVQTGIGRTGEWFAHQAEGIVPDAITVAKGLAGGVPIGALVTYGRAGMLFKPGEHGSTFGGNPLATAAGLAVLTEIERAGLLQNARDRSAELTNGIESLGEYVNGVRGHGLLLGVELKRPLANQVVAASLERGLIVNAPNETTIRLAPPLILNPDEVQEFLSIFADALAAVDRESTAASVA